MSSSTAVTRPRSIDWTAFFDRAGGAARGTGVAADVPAPDDEPRERHRKLSLEHYRQLFVDPAFVKPLLTTLWTSAAVGVLCVLAAAPMAWLVSRTDLPGKRLLRALILASFVTPPFLGAFAWVLLGGPNAGLINQWYYALFGLKPFEATPLINIFSAGVWLLVMVASTFLYVFTFVANSLDVIPSELEEASAIPGLAGTVSISRCRWSSRLLAGFLTRSAVDDAVRNTRDPGAAGG
jgi:ABC-type Fe3+ transport system permease subunit